MEKTTIDKMTEHFIEMKDATPEKREQLAEEVNILLDNSRDRLKEHLLNIDNIELAKQFNLI